MSLVRQAVRFCKRVVYLVREESASRTWRIAETSADIPDAMPAFKLPSQRKSRPRRSVMKIWIVESRMDVPGADWLPWDGKGFRNQGDAESECVKLRKKKTAVTTYQFRATSYEPSAGNKQ